MSPRVAALTRMFDMSDDFRKLCPLDLAMPHYYKNNGPEGTRIHRSYIYGEIKTVTDFYTPIILSFKLPANLKITFSQIHPTFPN